MKVKNKSIWFSTRISGKIELSSPIISDNNKLYSCLLFYSFVFSYHLLCRLFAAVVVAAMVQATKDLLFWCVGILKIFYNRVTGCANSGCVGIGF